MQFQYTRQRQRYFRLIRQVAFGLLTTQVAIATTVIHEVIATTPGFGQLREASAQSVTPDLRQLYRQASSSVVSIQTETGMGSGAIISRNGLIVTNAHVVEGSRQVRVTLQNGRSFTGEVVSIGSGKCLDLALVKIQAENLSALPLATSAPEIGMPVFAIGNPLGTDRTLTSGVVSNVAPEVGRIITDARLNPGNSGGPLLNLQGQLVGVIERGVGRDSGGDGLNVAVAAAQVKAMVQAMNSGLAATVGRFLIPASSSSNRLAVPLPLNGEAVTGAIQTGDNLMCSDDSRADLYTFQGSVDQPVMLSMTSAQIGSHLVLLGPDGDVVDYHTGQRNGSAMIFTTLRQAGTYTVIANAMRTDERGSYRLRATVPLLVKRDRLQASDPTLENGAFFRDYRFTGQRGQRITIALHQFEFDPYLAIVDSQGNIVAQGKVDRQTVLGATLPQAGTYTLIVSGTKAGDRGQFFLSVHNDSSAAQDR